MLGRLSSVRPSNTGSLTKHVIVLDLDETLVHSIDDMEYLHELELLNNPRYLNLRPRLFTLRLDNIMSKPGSGVVHEMWGTTRPYLKEFLKFCFTYFSQVIVWSAGKPGYVHEVVRKIFKDLRMPDRILTSEDCVYPYGKKDEPSYKPLRKIIGAPISVNQPLDDRGLQHIFILDDRKTTFSVCNPRNGILIPQYDAEDPESIMEDDTTFLQLMDWFRQPEVMTSNDVRRLNKRYIFNKPSFSRLPPIRFRNNPFSSPRFFDTQEEHFPEGVCSLADYSKALKARSSDLEEDEEDEDEYYLIPTRAN